MKTLEPVVKFLGSLITSHSLGYLSDKDFIDEAIRKATRAGLKTDKLINDIEGLKKLRSGLMREYS